MNHKPASYSRNEKTRLRRAWLLLAGLALSMAANVPTAFAEETGEAQAALIKVLPHSRLSLADGVRQAAKGGDVPISAKFEFDDAGKLSLSVYTAGKGLDSDAEHNV